MQRSYVSRSYTRVFVHQAEQELIKRWDSERECFTTTSYMYRPEPPTPIKLSS